MHPDAKMHHLTPTSRHGEDSEFNLFPWNEKAHAAWHRMFTIMTIREVWHVLADAHMLIFQSGGDSLIREWCLPYRYQAKKAVETDILTPQSITELRECWVTCFGGPDFRKAQRFVRYMMLYMVFGRYADHSSTIYESRMLLAFIKEVATDSDRSWAFRQCFGRMPHRALARTTKKIIRRVRGYARAIPIH